VPRDPDQPRSDEQQGDGERRVGRDLESAQRLRVLVGNWFNCALSRTSARYSSGTATGLVQCGQGVSALSASGTVPPQ